MAVLDQQVAAIHRALGLRWQDLANITAAFYELEGVVGEWLMHAHIQVSLGNFREHLERLTDAMGDMGHPFTPEPDTGRAAGWVEQYDWEVMGGESGGDGGERRVRRRGRPRALWDEATVGDRLIPTRTNHPPSHALGGH